MDNPFLVFNGDAPGLEFFLLLDDFWGFLKSSLRFVDPSSRGWRVLAGNLIGLMCNLGPVQLGSNDDTNNNKYFDYNIWYRYVVTSIIDWNFFMKYTDFFTRWWKTQVELPGFS